MSLSHVMRRSPNLWIAACVTALVIAMSGCGNEGSTTVSPGPSFQLQDCTLGDNYCAMIDEAIDYLEWHSDAACRTAGASARARFDAVGYGFRSSSEAPGGNTHPEFAAFVIQEPDYAKPSGYGPTDNNTYVNQSLFDNTTQVVGAKLGHEEVHQWGDDNPYHNTGAAFGLEVQCY